MNDDNLLAGRATQFKSGEEAARNGRKGGKASGKSKRRKKSMKAAAKLCIELRVHDAEAMAKFKEYGIPGDEQTNLMLLLIAMLEKAIDGDVKAAQFIRDTAGESPAEIMRTEELKHKQEIFEYKKECDSGEAMEIEDITDAELQIYGAEHPPVQEQTNDIQKGR